MTKKKEREKKNTSQQYYMTPTFVWSSWQASNFDTTAIFQLWSLYFSFAVAFITQRSLQLERYSDVKAQQLRDKLVIATFLP